MRRDSLLTHPGSCLTDGGHLMSHLRPSGRPKERLSLSYLSSFRGPPQWPHRRPLGHAVGGGRQELLGVIGRP
jgi:hypothetical protein